MTTNGDSSDILGQMRKSALLRISSFRKKSTEGAYLIAVAVAIDVVTVTAAVAVFIIVVIVIAIVIVIIIGVVVVRVGTGVGVGVGVGASADVAFPFFFCRFWALTSLIIAVIAIAINDAESVYGFRWNKPVPLLPTHFLFTIKAVSASSKVRVKPM